MKLDEAQRAVLDIPTGMGHDRMMITCPTIGGITLYPSRNFCDPESGDIEPEGWAWPREAIEPVTSVRQSRNRRLPDQQFVTTAWLKRHCARHDMTLDWTEVYLWA
jgi:hypothetical protein